MLMLLLLLLLKRPLLLLKLLLLLHAAAVRNMPGKLLNMDPILRLTPRLEGSGG
jgi:hypothetical protein